MFRPLNPPVPASGASHGRRSGCLSTCRKGRLPPWARNSSAVRWYAPDYGSGMPMSAAAEPPPVW